MQWKTICKETDLIPNVGVAAMFEGQQVALFYMPKTEKKVYALSNWDPFSKANVMSRGLLGDIGEKLVVSSPIYKQHFELDTGKCIEEAVEVPCWQAQLVNGDVQLSLT
ncbi:nitrite reductase small subunit NirD [Reinekea sp.]|jgi:nitrite reductase (NADH) small subunit|uniref:nitrite reductase small subunit NirD n=1 Tax=Reinekea sp. TaxID=1970455 RepID=UPI003989D12F